MKSHELRTALGLMAWCGEGWSAETGCTLLTAWLVLESSISFSKLVRPALLLEREVMIWISAEKVRCS